MSEALARRLLVTRPSSSAGEMEEMGRELGWELLFAPLMDIEPVRWALPERSPDALLLTSAEAFSGEGPWAELAHLPLFAVGRRTADAATAAGLKVHFVGDNDGTALLREAVAQGHHVLLSPGAGERAHIDVPPGVELIQPVSYRATLCPDLPEERVRQLLAGEVFATLLMSARTARHFTALVQQAGLDRRHIRLAVISPAVAAAVGIGWLAVEVASRPTARAVFAAAERLWQDIQHG